MGQSLAIPRVIPEDWKRLDLIVNKIKMRLGRDGSPTFANTYVTNTITAATSVFSKTCTVATGLNVLRVTGLQTDATALTGTLRGAYIDVSNGALDATGTIRGMELKARTEAPGDTGNDVAILEGLSISADSKGHGVTIMRAAEFILDGSLGGVITEAVGLRIANNLQADKATNSYAIQIYRDSFNYTYDISLSLGGHITGDSYVNQDLRTIASPTFVDVTATGTIQAEQLTSTDDAYIQDVLRASEIQVWPEALGVSSDGILYIFAEDSANYLVLSSNDAGTSDIYSVEQLYFKCGDNDFSFMESLYARYLRINVAGDNPLITSSTGIIDFDNENLITIGTITASNYTAANLLTACATNAGALNFSAAGKTLTVEDDAIVSQDYSSDAIPQFAGLGIGEAGVAGEIQITYNTSNLIRRVDIENTNAGNAARAGFIARTSQSELAFDAYGSGHAQANRVVINAITDTDFYIFVTAYGGTYGDIRIQNSTANLILTAATSLVLDGAYFGLANFNELRFYDDGANYVGFEAPALTANQIWALPNIDGGANELLKTDGGGNLGWTATAPPGAHLHDGDTLEHDGVNSSAGAFSFTTAGIVTFSNSITMSGGTNLTIPGHIIFNTDDSYIGFATARLTLNGTDGTTTLTGNLIIPDGGTVGNGVQLAFDDTNDFLEITGCDVVIGTTASRGKLTVVKDSNIAGQVVDGEAAISLHSITDQVTQSLVLFTDNTNNVSGIQSKVPTVGLSTLLLNPFGGNVGIGTADGVVNELLHLKKVGGNAKLEIESTTHNACIFINAPADEVAYIAFETLGAEDWQLRRAMNSDDFAIYNTDLTSDVLILKVTGGLFLKEQAAASAHSVAYGQIWVKTAAPNILMFTDDTGVDHGISPKTLIIHPSGQTNNTNVAGINILLLDLDGDNPALISGFTGGVAGQVLHVTIIDHTKSVTLQHIEGLSTQQLYLCDDSDETLSDSGGWVLICDGNNWYDCGHAKHVA